MNKEVGVCVDLHVEGEEKRGRRRYADVRGDKLVPIGGIERVVE
jgi:hypothetical protein